jgi:predicted nucleotidyltransferase
MSAPVDATLDEMIQRLVDGFAPRRIYLFGSRARGDQRPDSDYDLLVVLERCADRRKAAVAMRHVLRDMAAGKDIVVATQREIDREPGLILEQALREGQLVYERP